MRLPGAQGTHMKFHSNLPEKIRLHFQKCFVVSVVRRLLRPERQVGGGRHLPAAAVHKAKFAHSSLEHSRERHTFA